MSEEEVSDVFEALDDRVVKGGRFELCRRSLGTDVNSLEMLKGEDSVRSRVSTSASATVKRG